MTVGDLFLVEGACQQLLAWRTPGDSNSAAAPGPGLRFSAPRSRFIRDGAGCAPSQKGATERFAPAGPARARQNHVHKKPLSRALGGPTSQFLSAARLQFLSLWCRSRGLILHVVTDLSHPQAVHNYSIFSPNDVPRASLRSSPKRSAKGCSWPDPRGPVLSVVRVSKVLPHLRQSGSGYQPEYQYGRQR